MGGMAEEKKGASALSSSSSRSATSHSDDKTEAKSATRRTSSGKQSTSRTTSPRKRTTAKTPRASRTTKAATAAAVANGEVPAQSIPVADPSQFGRIAVMDVTPNEESGRFPARVELGEPFKVTAQVFIEGRTKVGATAIVRNHRGKEMQRLPMTCTNPGLDRWEVMLTCGEHSDVKPWQPEFAAIKRQLGEWSVTVEGWEDTYKSWLHDAAIKVKVNDDVENALESGAQLLERWAKTADAKLSAAQRKMLVAAAATMKDTSLTPEDRLAAATSEPVAQLHLTNPLRDGVSPSQPQRFLVQRPESSFAAWYQFFPRSEGAYVDPETGKIVQGTLKTSVSGLERAKAEGFDIVYLPPIFPIGKTNRKGRNNALEAGPDDPGSPFGIGSELGGHDTVDPLLGNMDDFKALVAKAHELGLEIALDFALQCSPDHPWVKQHPDWFRHKPDGSIAFAENPPKKYQDIYPIDFNADMPGIEKEVERVLELWINAGVTIFRIDNPHTKPVRFWQDVIAAVTKKHPEILFLAEAFTRPGMMRALSYVGFTQSHCYFPWRNTKEELGKYLETTNGDDGYYQHNTFWPTTPDILTAYVRDNGIAGHAVRAGARRDGQPELGHLQRLELIENKQRPVSRSRSTTRSTRSRCATGRHADKYGIAELLTNLNRVRREHPKVFSYHNLTVLESSDPNILALPATHPRTDRHRQAGDADRGGEPDGHEAHQAMVHLELPDYGIDPKWGAHIHDELTGRDFAWSWDNFVSLAPWAMWRTSSPWCMRTENA